MSPELLHLEHGRPMPPPAPPRPWYCGIELVCPCCAGRFELVEPREYERRPDPAAPRNQYATAPPEPGEVETTLIGSHAGGTWLRTACPDCYRVMTFHQRRVGAPWARRWETW